MQAQGYGFIVVNRSANANASVVICEIVCPGLGENTAMLLTAPDPVLPIICENADPVKDSDPIVPVAMDVPFS